MGYAGSIMSLFVVVCCIHNLSVFFTWSVDILRECSDLALFCFVWFGQVSTLEVLTLNILWMWVIGQLSSMASYVALYCYCMVMSFVVFASWFVNHSMSCKPSCRSTTAVTNISCKMKRQLCYFLYMLVEMFCHCRDTDMNILLKFVSGVSFCSKLFTATF